MVLEFSINQIHKIYIYIIQEMQLKIIKKNLVKILKQEGKKAYYSIEPVTLFKLPVDLFFDM